MANKFEDLSGFKNATQPKVKMKPTSQHEKPARFSAHCAEFARSTKTMPSIVLAAAIGAIYLPCAGAASVTVANIFDPTPGGANPVTATASSSFNGSFPAANVNNGASSIFVFGGSDTTTPSLNFSGFNSSIDSLEFFDSNFADRVAPSVSIYYSTANTTSLAPANYTQVGAGSFTLTYSGTTSGAADNVGGHQLTYATVSGLGVPNGTESLLFVFGATGGSASSANSYGIAEIEAFSVPEPSVAVLMGVGSLLLISWQCRRFSY